MNVLSGHKRRRPILTWRAIGWAGAAAVLLLPLFAMQFTSEVNWTFGDFLFAGILLGLLGGGIELAARVQRDRYFKVGAVLAVLTAFFTTWANAAVGLIGSGENPVNILFFGVIFFALLGSAFSKRKSNLLALTMLVAGILHIGIAAIFGLFGGDVPGGTISSVLGTVWWFAAAGFHASHKRSRT